jgi:hypothetical protein
MGNKEKFASEFPRFPFDLHSPLVDSIAASAYLHPFILIDIYPIFPLCEMSL